MKKTVHDIAIIGGGAAGFFAALACAEKLKELGKQANVVIYEGQRAFLRKVKISGGGRCNVTHHEFDPQTFCESYPRGKRELRSPFAQFQAKDTIDWFAKRGVTIVAESDGRMFPATNESQTVIDCFRRECDRLGVTRIASHKIHKVERDDDGLFTLISKEEQRTAQSLLIATGSDRSGYELIRSLGHKMTDLAPSLFSFKISDPLLKNMAGTSFKHISVKASFPKGKKMVQGGAGLITHHGLSGPAIFKLSAWAAREMKDCAYHCPLFINWTPFEREDDLLAYLEQHRQEFKSALVKNRPPHFFTKNFWSQFLQVHEIPLEKKYSELGDKALRKITAKCFSYPCEMRGQNRFKDEFVECGGVSSKEINFKTMESKIVENLFFAGEVLDIDGVTGGFNFQNAWTTGFIAGNNLAFTSLK